VSDEPGVPAGGGDQRQLVARLRAVIEAKDAENAVLRAELRAQLERYRRCGTGTRATIPATRSAAGCATTKNRVWLFTTQFAVDWTNNCSEQAVKAAKRHQAVSGYWHTQRTLARWCRIRSYLDSAATHGLTALDATTRALASEPWLPIPNRLKKATETAARYLPLNGHPARSCGRLKPG
jgi:hypothetical protein